MQDCVKYELRLHSFITMKAEDTALFKNWDVLKWFTDRL